jgi:hypothetical protein
LLHGLNPWGFKNLRRVTENNVDLNRNCDDGPDLFSIKNDGYAALIDFINPLGKADAESFQNRLFHLLAIKKIADASMSKLRQAILQGQYRFEKGIFFGGRTLESQVMDIRAVLQEKAARYETILTIDLHTGYGSRGTLHLLSNPIDDPKFKQSAENLFAGYPVDWGDSEESYPVTGELPAFIGKVLTNSVCLPMTFEYGTLNSQTNLGAIKSLHVMILENQGYHYGYISKNDEFNIRNGFVEMFYPSSKGWRSEIIRQTRGLLKKVLPHFAGLSLQYDNSEKL